ncbi:MAG: glycosyltransferase involved in cell wall biosynthesis [Parasphingorhabdus sp.]|jgi:glycosyltransferase involved in cell wall biosynthesis
MSTPSVSVVMPAYNHEKFVGSAIASVLEQSYSDLELIIINDGSTDTTESVIKEFDDPRIRYHLQDNQDAYNALNRGMGLAAGEYIAIINSDDVYHSDRIQKCVELHQSQGVEFIFTDVTPINDSGESIDNHPWQAWHQNNRNYYFEEMDLYRGFLHGNFMVTTSNIFMTRELQCRTGNFSSLRYLHDYDFVFRLLIAAEHRSVYLQDECLLFYRIHSSNTLSEAAITGREQDKWVIRNYLMELIPEQHRVRANTAVDRLVALEHELIDVRSQLRKQQQSPHPVVPKSFIHRLQNRIKRALQ